MIARLNRTDNNSSLADTGYIDLGVDPKLGVELSLPTPCS
jgi:hypothetical protein